jgi:hypothetical protein
MLDQLVRRFRTIPPHSTANDLQTKSKDAAVQIRSVKIQFRSRLKECYTFVERISGLTGFPSQNQQMMIQRVQRSHGCNVPKSDLKQQAHKSVNLAISTLLRKQHRRFG